MGMMSGLQIEFHLEERREWTQSSSAHRLLALIPEHNNLNEDDDTYI